MTNIYRIFLIYLKVINILDKINKNFNGILVNEYEIGNDYIGHSHNKLWDCD